MKLRKTKRKDGGEGKAVKRLRGRVYAWENRTGDAVKKHPNGMKKPGRGY